MAELIADLKAPVASLGADDLRALAKDGRPRVRAIATREQKRRERAAAEDARLEVMLEPERELWAQGYELIAGVDEAGAGPWAGPVVAGAVILPRDIVIRRLDDSKKLSVKLRESLVVEIRERAIAYGIGSCSPEEIDSINIKEASRLAMQRAVMALHRQPDHLLVDWRQVPGVEMPQAILVHGDSRSLAIAAASVLAKTHRDAIMAEMAEKYPGYGFERHVGYGTAEHQKALVELGICPIHRKSFKPVARAAGLNKAHGSQLLLPGAELSCD